MLKSICLLSLLTSNFAVLCLFTLILNTKL